MKTIPVALVASLNAFLSSVNKAVTLYREKNFPSLDKEMVAVANIGGRYAKLAFFKENEGEWKAHSVYCFVDLTNGDILKGTWKAPVAKGVRGNLKDANILTKVTIYGPAYLNGSNYDTVSDVLAKNLGR